MAASITHHAVSPLELSRAAATYFVHSPHSSLPQPLLLPWSLGGSYTRFGLGVSLRARAKTGEESGHLRSSALIEDEPNRDEENHIAGCEDSGGSSSQNSHDKSGSGRRRSWRAAVTMASLPHHERCYPVTGNASSSSESTGASAMQSNQHGSHNATEKSNGLAAPASVARRTNKSNDAESTLPPHSRQHPGTGNRKDRNQSLGGNNGSSRCW